MRRRSRSNIVRSGVWCDAPFIFIFFLRQKRRFTFFRLIMLSLPTTPLLLLPPPVPFYGCLHKLYKLSVRIRYFLCSAWLIMHKKKCIFFCARNVNLWIIIHSKKMCEKKIIETKRERNRFFFLVRCELCECYDVELVGVGVDCVVSSCSQSLKEIEILYLRCAHISFVPVSPPRTHKHTHTLTCGEDTIFWLYAHKRAHSLVHNVDEMPFTRFRMCKSMTSTRNMDDSDTHAMQRRRDESKGRTRHTKRFAQKYLHKTNRVNITARTRHPRNAQMAFGVWAS